MDGLFLSGDKISIEERARESHTEIDEEVGAGFVAIAKVTQERWKFLAQFHWRFRYKKFAREECYLDDGDNLMIEIWRSKWMIVIARRVKRDHFQWIFRAINLEEKKERKVWKS